MAVVVLANRLRQGDAWLQIRMRDLAVDATYNGQPLPVLYEIYYRRWFMLGWPAFIGVLIIFYLMVAKPAL